MSGAGGRYNIGRFFVTTQQTDHHDLHPSKGPRNKHGGSKRVKKYGMPLSYPEPTIHEETSPNDTEETAGVGSSGKAQDGSSDLSHDIGYGVSSGIDGGDGSAQSSGVRPRSGTWSVANSRRVKIKAEKEEEASFRQRRKSGDDILAAATNNANNVASSRRKEGGPQGFFDSFRPRSKSDARAILAARQRRKSGDDVLNATTKEKEKKKEASPGFFESFRPRSKSDASRVGKKPNLMTTFSMRPQKRRKRKRKLVQDSLNHSDLVPNLMLRVLGKSQT